MSRIQKFINKNASLAIQQRAKEIIQSNLIHSINYNSQLKLLQAGVIGNQMYSVIIDLSLKTKINTNCNCPYDRGGLCKHVVAILMKYEEKKDLYEEVIVEEEEDDLEYDGFEEDEEIYDDSEDDDYDDDEEAFPPAIIHGYEELTAQSIKELSNQGTLYKAKSMIDQVKIDDYDGESIIGFMVEDRNSYYYPTDAFVSFSMTDKGLEAECNCREHFSFCSHILAVLLFTSIKQNNPSFFTFLNTKNRKEQMRVYAAKFGITGIKDIEKVLEIQHDEQQVFYNFINKYAGLQPVDAEQLEYKKVTLRQERKKLTDIEHFLSGPILEEEAEEHGFGVIFTMDTDNDNQLIGVHCMSARLNKKGDKMITPFNYIMMEDHPDLSSNHKQILETASKLNKYVSDSQDREKRIHVTFAQLKEIFHHFDSETHLFIREKQNWHADYYDKLKKGDLKPTEGSKIPYYIEFDVECDEDFIMLIPYFIFGASRVKITEEIISACHLDYFFANYNDKLFLAKDINTISAILGLIDEPIQKMVLAHRELFMKEIVLPLTENFEVNFTPSTKTRQTFIESTSMKKKLYISGIGQFVLFKPYVVYTEDIEVNILTNGTHVSMTKNAIQKLQRDQSVENEFYQLMKSLHPKLNKQFPEEFFHLEAKDMLKEHWFFSAFDKLSEADVEVLGLNELKNFNYNPKRGRITTSMSSGRDWFDVKVEVAYGDLKVSLADVRKAVLKKDRFIKLSDGSLGILPAEWFEKFGRMFRHGEIKNGELKISNRKFMIIEELFDNLADESILQELYNKRKKLEKFTQIKSVKIPNTIKAELRDYQKEGLNWLNFLDTFGWGGILADDMGLGKTLQILTFIARQKTKKTNLIVVPTTLMFNWENEIEKFYPSLKAHFHYGPNRLKTTDEFKKHQLVITTYGMVVSDIEWMKNFSFSYVILDESQAVKNPQSLRFKAVCLLNAKNRVTLTGTPIENNTFDLYAQMHFANPGLLGSSKSFRDNYSLPIDKNGDKERADELRKMINPFMIRRTKEQVAKELPPKTDEILYCHMEKDQRKVYTAYRNKYRDMLMGRIQQDGLEKSKLYVLDGLMKLRQICDSPQLLSDEENYGSESVKVEELIRNIKEKTGNHKIVVFSQFITMLSIIRKRLEEINISYEYLDGKTLHKNRQKSVEHFQADDTCRVFLISLKAGGTGLNLTAADYVFLVDPWWNPAVEEQAIDRCYRIGQDKKVFAYRMICKDTIEEKIINHQQSKKALADDIIQAEESFVKSLTADDIKGLFS